MSQRHVYESDLDDFPTPPWATRALLRHGISDNTALQFQSCWEPACNRGYMAATLKESFGSVRSSDIGDYGYGDVRDFLSPPVEESCVDWVITNPPFALAEQFVITALSVARRGVAMLTRTAFIEGKGRYERLFSKRPPTRVAQFAERVPMVKGRLDAKASTATSYCWMVWESHAASHSQVLWIPPCRTMLERPGDYDTCTRTSVSPNDAALRTNEVDLFDPLLVDGTVV